MSLNRNPCNWVTPPLPQRNGFFTSFNFTLSFRPGSRNIKPDALLRQFLEGEELAEGPATILPPPCVVTTLTWDIEEMVWIATEGQPGPRVGLYVPDNLCPEVLKWGHSSRVACHPGELVISSTNVSGGHL